MYNKPTVFQTEDLTEGVYAASGSADTCYTTTAKIHQRPETGRGDYRIQVEGNHAANHTRYHQMLHISFNQPVTLSSSNGTLRNGNGTTTLEIEYNYTQNPTDNIGLGDLVVTSDAGLFVTNVYITDWD